MSNTDMTWAKNSLRLAVVGLMSLAFVAFTSGCSAEEINTDVNGDWVYMQDDVVFTGTVAEGGITLYVGFDGAKGAKGLYWVGTFPDTMDDGASTVSDADTQKLEGSLYGSMDSTKEFTYSGGKLQFDFTMLGVTKTVEMQR